MNENQDKQLEKTKKTGMVSQAQSKIINSSRKLKSSIRSDNIKRKNEKNESNPKKTNDSKMAVVIAPTLNNNTISAIDNDKKKKGRDISEIIYYSYNKKGYLTKNCVRSKNELQFRQLLHW